MAMTIEVKPKDNTVGSALSAILDKYIEVSNRNGLPVHRIIVNNCLMYWDNEEVLKELENGNNWRN